MGEAVGQKVPLGDLDLEGETEAVVECVPVPPPPGAAPAEGEGLVLALAHLEALGVLLGQEEALMLRVPLAQRLGVEEALGLRDTVLQAVLVELREGLCDGLGLRVSVVVAVVEGQAVTLRVRVGVDDTERLLEGEPVAEGQRLVLGQGEAVDDLVEVGVKLCVTEDVEQRLG